MIPLAWTNRPCVSRTMTFGCHRMPSNSHFNTFGMSAHAIRAAQGCLVKNPFQHKQDVRLCTVTNTGLPGGTPKDHLEAMSFDQSHTHCVSSILQTVSNTGCRNVYRPCSVFLPFLASRVGRMTNIWHTNSDIDLSNEDLAPKFLPFLACCV